MLVVIRIRLDQALRDSAQAYFENIQMLTDYPYGEKVLLAVCAVECGVFCAALSVSVNAL